MNRSSRLLATGLALSLAVNSWAWTEGRIVAPLFAVVRFSKAHNAPGDYRELSGPDGTSYPETVVKRYTLDGVARVIADFPDSLAVLLPRPSHAVYVWTEGDPQPPDVWYGRNPLHTLELGTLRQWLVLNAATGDSVYWGTMETEIGAVCLLRTGPEREPSEPQ